MGRGGFYQRYEGRGALERYKFSKAKFGTATLSYILLSQYIPLFGPGV